MKLVRVRPKDPAHFPAWARCCQGHIDDVQEEGEFTVDADEVREISRVCRHCGADHGVRRAVRDVNVPRIRAWEAVELLDFNEGEEEMPEMVLQQGKEEAIHE